MKKSNIVFSGIMATILMGAGAANAATVIASQGYVDRKDAEITTNLEQNYATKESVSALDDAINNQETGLAGKVDSLDDVINNPDTGLANTVGELETVVNDPDSGLASKVDDAVAAAGEASTKVDEIQTTVDELGTTVGDAESGLVKDVNDLGTAVGGVEATLGDETMTTTAQTVTGAINEIDADLTNKEDKSNKIQEITAESTADQYPSAVAVRTALDAKADSTTVEQIEQTFQEITTPGTGLVDVVGDAEGGLVKDVADLQGTVGNAESGLVADVAGAVETANDASAKVDGMQTTVGELETSVGALETTVGDENSGLVKDVADANAVATAAQEAAEEAVAGLEGKQDALGFVPEDSANRATAITPENQASETNYPSVGAIVNWTNEKINELSDSGLPVNPDSIGSGAINNDKLAPDAVTEDKIADDAVGTDQIKDDAVTADQIAPDAVGNEQIADGAVTTDKLGQDVQTALDGKVDESELGALAKKNQITDADVADDAAIAKSKLAEDVQVALDNAANAVSMTGATPNSVLGTGASGEKVWYAIAE